MKILLERLILRHQFNTKNIQSIFIEFTDRDFKTKEEAEYKKQVEEKYFQYLYDLQYSDENFAEEFFTLLNTEKFDILKIYSFSTVSWYFELLSKIDQKGEQQYKNFYLGVIKKNIKRYINSMGQLNNFLEQGFIKISSEDDEELRKFYKKNKADKQQAKKSTDKNEILKKIESVDKNSGLSPKDETILNSIDESLHLSWLEDDAKYFKITLDFVSWLQSFSGNTPFKDFYDKTIKNYKTLSNKGEYKNKMRLVLEKLNIDTTEE